jgi:hypothetical protein
MVNIFGSFMRYPVADSLQGRLGTETKKQVKIFFDTS